VTVQKSFSGGGGDGGRRQIVLYDINGGETFRFVRKVGKTISLRSNTKKSEGRDRDPRGGGPR